MSVINIFCTPGHWDLRVVGTDNCLSEVGHDLWAILYFGTSFSRLQLLGLNSSGIFMFSETIDTRASLFLFMNNESSMFRTMVFEHICTGMSMTIFSAMFRGKCVQTLMCRMPQKENVNTNGKDQVLSN